MASVPRLELGHRIYDYSRFSKPLPYLLGLYRLIWRRVRDSNSQCFYTQRFSGPTLLPAKVTRQIIGDRTPIRTEIIRFVTG